MKTHHFCLQSHKMHYSKCVHQTRDKLKTNDGLERHIARRIDVERTNWETTATYYLLLLLLSAIFLLNK